MDKSNRRTIMDITTFFIIAQTIWDMFLITLGSFITAYWIVFCIMVFSKEDPQYNENNKSVGLELIKAMRKKLNKNT